jgi:hypothetical protein
MRKFTLKRVGGLALLAVIAAVAITPAAAMADPLANPSADTYNPQSQVQGTNTTGSNDGNGNGPTASTSTGLSSNVGSLPFTGMDLIVLVIVAGALVGTGVALRRLSAPKSQV